MATAQLADVGLHGSADRYGDLCVHGVIDVRRTFSRAAIERAVHATVASFPVLGCIYEQHFFRDRWVPLQTPISEMVHIGIERDLETDTNAWIERWIDPAQERPFRVVVLPRSAGCRLVVSVSHLAADGAGMAAVAHVFAAHLYGVRPGLPVESRRDVARALDGLQLKHLPVFVKDLAKSALQPWRIYSAGPRNRPYPANSSQRGGWKQIVIEPSTMAMIEKRCGQRVRVNDLLMAIVAMVAARRSSYGPISVMYTMDLRRYSRRPHLSVANVSSILTTIVPREATSDIVDAVHAVAEQTKEHRNGLAGPAFLLLPMLLAGRAPHAFVRQLLPLLHPLLVELPTSRGFIFTNVGKIDAGLGPLTDDIEDIRVIGPSIKNISSPAIIAFGFRGRIHLELFAAPGLSPDALDELERELSDGLCELAGTNEPVMS